MNLPNIIELYIEMNFIVCKIYLNKIAVGYESFMKIIYSLQKNKQNKQGK